MTEESKKLLVVLNPISGGRKKEKFPELLERFCKRNKYLYKIYETQGGEKDKEEILRLKDLYQPDVVVAVGGDGTINLVAGLVVGSSLPVAIVPMGSANGLAKDLGIPEDPIKALNLIKDFHYHEIDTLKVNGENCFHIADFGFNARIVRRFSKSLIRGKISYIWYGLQEFFSFDPFSYAIETEEFKIQGKAFMIAVMNAKKFGINVNINPLGKIDDGFFEISVIKPFSKLSSLKVLYHLLSKTIHKSKYNRVVRCKKAIIYNSDQTSFHIDGEPIPSSEKIEITIVPKGLTLIMPCCREE